MVFDMMPVTLVFVDHSGSHIGTIGADAPVKIT
jgi:hypothetical protein